ncbi:MAG: hypothetical protein C0466_02720 [Candidatus Accumulibacter sp.]|nr:hypothetical protein [Accumulibacter sp.]
MRRFRRFLPLVSAFFCFVLFAALVPSLYARPRSLASPEMEVALPRFVQVMMAAGDRFLAANLAGFRALVVSTEKMTAENYRILGIVQSDVAWLNPAHEDNYYIAAAILPWSGEVAAAQYILQRASEARPFDWQPAFYYAFDALHFQKNPVKGAEWLRIAADHSPDEMEKIQLQQLAAQWVSRGEDKEMAIRMLRTMARETQHEAFARFLERRAVRLENIAALEAAATLFREREGRAPTRVDELVGQGLLSSLPADPFNMLYTFDTKGAVIAVRPDADALRKTP